MPIGSRVILSVVTGKEIADGDLKKPFKETAKTLLTQRIIEFTGPEFKIPANVKLHDGSTDPEDHLSRFSSAANLGEWPMPVWCRMFQQTLDGSARGWFEHLPLGSIDRWAELRTQFTTRFSTRRACFKDPTEITKIVMIISLFMDAHKFPKLAKRYSDKVPKTVDEMMVRMDDFVRSEEAFANTELHKGEVSKASKKLAGSVPRGNHQGYQQPMLNLNSLTKQPKEILASELQLNLQAPRPIQLPPKKVNQDRYCDYHREKGHYTNDCLQLRIHLELALASGKLNQLIKDVRQRGRGNSKGRDRGIDKVINMILSWSDERKKKYMETEEIWMRTPVVFLAVSTEDISDEPIIIEVVMEGYQVHRIHVDQGVSVEVMFQHCFENLSPAMKSRLKSIQTDLVGFARDVVKSLGMVELEVVFGDGGLFRRVTMNFTVIRSPSSRLEKKQMVEKEAQQSPPHIEVEAKEVSMTEEMLVNPTHLEQLVTIGETLMEGCKAQLQMLLKKKVDV
ncbi:hypothetical protein Tco_0901843 [Tanacetum coccineum]